MRNAPLAVWDVRQEHHSTWYSPRTAWARKHFPQYADDTFRAEFYQIDGPSVVLFRYAENAEGRRYLDPATGVPAVQEPLTIHLDKLPPKYLLRN